METVSSPGSTVTHPFVVGFLEQLCGKEYSQENGPKIQIRHSSSLSLLFTSIIGVLEESAQVEALDAILQLVRANCSNIELCLKFGLQSEILRFLTERGLYRDSRISTSILKKILRLFLYLSNHSVETQDICAMLHVFRHIQLTDQEPDDIAVSYYVSTLEMIARDAFGPASFFDLSGEYSGLVLPIIDTFPTAGYTFCAWIKFEILPELPAPLFTFCGKLEVGLVCSFIRSSLTVTCLDKNKNDSHIEIPDLITAGRWHFLCLVHTHRQIRGSKLDVYLNGELRQSGKLTYPNTTVMNPVVHGYIGMRQREDRRQTPPLRVLLGPLALFGQPLPSSIISNIKSADEYDALVLQFNSYISSSSGGPTSNSASMNPTTGPSLSSTSAHLASVVETGEGLLFAYDARNCDRQRGLCFDSSGNHKHAEAAGTGVRVRRSGTFKQAVAQLGGPLICLPLLVHSSINDVTVQFEQDRTFLSHMTDLITRPLGFRTIPKVIQLIAEIMRHSLVNKFIFRRHQGIRLMALLLRSLPPSYLTSDLILSLERFRSAVVSDRTLSEDIYKHLLFNFRMWINATTELQHVVFDKLEEVIRKDTGPSSAASTRHFLRCLSWIYWKQESSIQLFTPLERIRTFTMEEIEGLRKRLLSIITLELCESQPIKTSIGGRGTKDGKEVKTQLSYESTRSLIFCMIGKPTNPITNGFNADGTPSLYDSGEVVNKHSSEGEGDAGTIVENVPEGDLPDLLELLIELSLQPTAPIGLLDLFGRLGGLRIWLPLLHFSNRTLRVMTLRLVRTFLTLKCECQQDREKSTHPDKLQLSMGDSYLILKALNEAGHPITIGVYTEVLFMMIGLQVTASEMKIPGPDSKEYDVLMNEDRLKTLMVWHGHMMFPFLEMVRNSPMKIRLLAIRHLHLLFASSTTASAINRTSLIYNSLAASSFGVITASTTTEPTPIIEAILSLRGVQMMETENYQEELSKILEIELTPNHHVPVEQLRLQVLDTMVSEEERIQALYALTLQDEGGFVTSLLHQESSFQTLSNRIKMAAIEILSHVHPQKCRLFITETAYEIISSIVCLEAKTNDMSWILLQDPFTTLSRVVTSSKDEKLGVQLEQVVVTLLETTLNKMHTLLSMERSGYGEQPPGRNSILWQNAENLATLSAAIVLHYDPDTLGKIDPSRMENKDVTVEPVYWKCERVLWHEKELIDAILQVWQHFTSSFHSEQDASFGRKYTRSLSRENAAVGATTIPTTRRSNSKTGISFGFNLLPTQTTSTATTNTTQTPTASTVSMRPHPGGPMRQVLQLFLRRFYLLLPVEDKSSANSEFMQQLEKLESYIKSMGLGRDIEQFESSFTPFNGRGTTGNTSNLGSGGLVGNSSFVKATPGDETSLLLWFIPELSILINHVRRQTWSDAAIKLASILAKLVIPSIRSSDELFSLLRQHDFILNNIEVLRRDGFYFEQMAHARESRVARRAIMLEYEVEQKSRAKAELERISRSTRTQTGTTNDVNSAPVWLQRIKAKDIDDWMRLRVILKWGVRHVWSDSSSRRTLSDALYKNDFWRLDTYTSSNWVRCRLLPDTDDTSPFSGEPSGVMQANTNVVEKTGDGVDTADNMMLTYEEGHGDEGDDRADDSQEIQDEYEDQADATVLEESALERTDSYDHDDEYSRNGVIGYSGYNETDPNDQEKQPTGLSGEWDDLGSLTARSRRTNNDAPLPTEDVAMSVKAASNPSAKDKFIPKISRFRLFGASKGSVNNIQDSPDATKFLIPSEIPQVPLPTDTTPSHSEPPSITPPTPPSSNENATTLKNDVAAAISRDEQWKTLSACYRTKVYLTLPSGLMVYGLLRIGTTTIVFEGEHVTTLEHLSLLTDDTSVPPLKFNDTFVSELKRRVWGVRVIRVIHRRRFLLNGKHGLELCFVDGSSCLLGFENDGETEVVYATLRERKPPCLAKWNKRLLTTERLFGKSKWTEMWIRREISNYEYLMQLNMASGRSFNDLTQYPIFPWVLQDYMSNELHLEDPTVYRDLTKPIGGQTEQGREAARTTYMTSKGKAPIPAYHYATSYSHLRCVFYFLCRLVPITNAFSIGHAPNNVFNSVEDAYVKATTEENAHYELTPEFYCLADFLTSHRNQQLVKAREEENNGDGGLTQLARELHTNVILPPWASSPHDFIRQHRSALESDYVSQHLHHWIDLIFGNKQSGRPAVDAENSFHLACRPERLELSSLNIGARARLTQRGTLPIQLFKKPHPVRMSQDESLEARYPASHATASLTSRRQVRRHDLSSKHKTAVVNIRFASAFNSSGLSTPGLGSGTGIGAHSSGSSDSHGIVVYTSDEDGVVLAKRYLNTVPDPSRSCPFSLVDIDQWWKLPAGSLVRDGVVFYEQMISCGYWDGSWRIHWSADGELLQRIAFHKKLVLCMAVSEDDFTGDLALAFGSEDCTVSVWAISKMAATRSRRLFVKKELPIGGLPWAVLHGHTNPVVAVALNVDLDIVVSSSRDNTILVHSLRSATSLHNVEIASPTRSIVTHITISSHGDILIHCITNRSENGSSSLKLRPLSVDMGKPLSDILKNDVDTSTSEQSHLYIVSMNGQLVSHNPLLSTMDGTAQVILDRGVMFTRSGEYIITATGGTESVIEVRDSGRPNVVVRRIECKRTGTNGGIELTSVSKSKDERCVVCGYSDGAVVAYALHYGISDGCKNSSGLDQKAREVEAEAIAKAHKRDLLKKEKKELFKRASTSGNGVDKDGNACLWIKPSGKKITMPDEPFLSAMQATYTLLKQPCLGGDPVFEALLEQLWLDMYDPNRVEMVPAPAVTDTTTTNLLDIPLSPVGKAKQQYERAGTTWSRMGFQRPDPTTDFRAGGILSLKCLMFFTKHSYEHASSMVEHNIPESRENTYPWGPAGINLTCMLAQLLWDSEGCLDKDRADAWYFFEDGNAFFIIFSEVFLLFDHLWKDMNAHYGAFSHVMQATKATVLDAMEESKGNLHSFLAEIRARSMSHSGRNRKGRATSRSMDEFLLNMGSNIANAQQIASNALGTISNRGTDLFGENALSLSPPLQPNPTIQQPTNLIDLGSPPKPTQNKTSSIPFDPFAGNDFRGMTLGYGETEDNDDSTIDPFACLT